ncbi:BTAD domain-containing putative transcriptional regulator [Kutzneria kofuensis]|uniref:Transcriptional regulator with XRE-family HTH domain n=1 Tax=Kutzneria kofuensis TaxID=103725 RepID=A0A7W9KRG3_9PSEU|nr:helix-turn-helix domain-containing protein [Kutzneria kofuensis]MBB5897280.1 transcriptional regulator with XRE-family HTH domain [Kutzneria kofuensis]
MDDGQFGRSLRLQRQIAGLTQRELAVRAGVSVRTLRYWENGKINTPRMASRQQIQRVLDGVPPSSGDQVRIGVLGALTVQGRSRELGMLRPKAAALLGVVALQPNEEVSRDEVIDVLWGDTPPTSYPRLLRGHADAVRRMLGQTPWLASVGKSGGFLLRAERGQLDLLEFRALAGRAAAARSMGDLVRAYELYAAGFDCWRGAPLVGFDTRLRHHPAAVALTNQRAAVAMEYADLGRRIGRHAEVDARLRRWAPFTAPKAATTPITPSNTEQRRGRDGTEGAMEQETGKGGSGRAGGE